MKDKIFSGQELEGALKSKEFEHSEVELIGMVKSSEKPGHIAFARGGCDTWVDIPTAIIEQAEQLGRRPCKDHWHPQFRITLKQSDSPEARVLGELLAKSPIGFSGPSYGMAGSNAPMPGGNIWGGNPPRMSPDRMSPGRMSPGRMPPHMIRQRIGGGGEGVGGGLGDNDYYVCLWLVQCRPNPFRWDGWECWMELCCWDPDYGWDCPWLRT
jgi:hypothetical protein